MFVHGCILIPACTHTQYIIIYVVILFIIYCTILELLENSCRTRKVLFCFFLLHSAPLKKNGNLCLNDVLEMSKRCLIILMWFVLFLERDRMYMFSFIFSFFIPFFLL